MNLSKAMKLYAITHRDFMKYDFLGTVRQSLLGGVTMLQIREKKLDKDEFIKVVLDVKPLCKEFNVPLIVNDNVDVFEETDVDGIHIGQDDEALINVRKRFPNKIIGVSVNSLSQALKAEKEGADYLGVGAMFNTSTKDNAETISFETLKDITDSVSIPVCAIGGITAKNISELKHSNIDGVSVISEIYNKEDVELATKELKNSVENILVKKVLTIAGSDSSGGAGIQADLKTMTAHKKYGMTVITAITAQNTISVDHIEEISEKGIEMQLESVFSDIVPDSIKIGMVSNKDTIKKISEILEKYNAHNIVLDPVMVSTSGYQLIKDEAIEMLKDKLFPLARLITPNIPEAELLSNIEIKTEEDMIKAAKIIGNEYNVSVLVKGGHLVNEATDILFDNQKITKFVEEFVECNNTHGTGCTLSSAIACNLADKYSLEDSIKNAKKFLVDALKNDLDLGKGSGPLNHLYKIDWK